MNIGDTVTSTTSPHPNCVGNISHFFEDHFSDANFNDGHMAHITWLTHSDDCRHYYSPGSDKYIRNLRITRATVTTIHTNWAES